MMGFKITAVFGLLVVGSGMSFARPQVSEAERRALDGQDMFDPNPVYTYNYQVSNDLAQTYIAQKESRDGDAVSGEYSYVDALGNLVTVTYTANDADGYSETREVQENFVQIRSKPVKKEVSTSTVVEATSSSSSDSNLVARIIAQLSPFIKETVASSLNSQQQFAAVAQPAPIVSRFVAVEPLSVVTSNAVVSKFGTGAGNNIRVETPEYTFATDL